MIRRALSQEGVGQADWVAVPQGNDAVDSAARTIIQGKIAAASQQNDLFNDLYLVCHSKSQA
jgi:hypothetical protein